MKKAIAIFAVLLSTSLFAQSIEWNLFEQHLSGYWEEDDGNTIASVVAFSYVYDSDDGGVYHDMSPEIGFTVRCSGSDVTLVADQDTNLGNNTYFWIEAHSNDVVTAECFDDSSKLLQSCRFVDGEWVWPKIKGVAGLPGNRIYIAFMGDEEIAWHEDTNEFEFRRYYGWLEIEARDGGELALLRSAFSYDEGLVVGKGSFSATGADADVRVRFIADDGGDAVEKMYVRNTVVSVLPRQEAKYDGTFFYYVMGWCTDAGAFVTTNMVVADEFDCHAIWMPSGSTVAFSLDGKGARIGGGALVQTMPQRWYVEPPVVQANEGYVFCGWQCNPDEVVSNGIVHAIWRRDTSVRIPVLSSDAPTEVVNATLDDLLLVDRQRLKSVIGGNAAKYGEFRAWARSVLDGELAAMASERASESFMFGTAALLSNSPTIEMDASPAATGSGFVVSATVKDGGNAVAVSSARVAEMFEATSSLGDWEGGAKIVPEVTDLTDGVSDAPRFSVSLGASPTAFFRIRAK